MKQILLKILLSGDVAMAAWFIEGRLQCVNVLLETYRGDFKNEFRERLTNFYQELIHDPDSFLPISNLIRALRNNREKSSSFPFFWLGCSENFADACLKDNSYYNVLTANLAQPSWLEIKILTPL